MRNLHVELVKLQEWVKREGKKVCVIFEGRDGAGKGGVIKAMTERVSPRVFRVVAMAAPTEREKTQMYVQRYLPHLPSGGEIVIFDRSWYNRAGVERVMGFCTEDQAKGSLNTVPSVEKSVVESGIVLLKYWLEVSPEELTNRLTARINDKEHGYPRELWTTRLLARHAREHGPTAGHECLARLVQGTVCKILGREEIKPHKVRYYLERRDAEFEQKMAEVLCVYREVQVLKRAAAKSRKAIKRVAIVSYDEKPGIQAIATTAPDLPPKPGVHASFARDYEYKRHGTLSLLAEIDLLTGKVHALVRDRHRSREFIEFLKCLDAAYPASTAIKLILDNHSAHISRETTAWLDARPPGRFEFTFTPKHGSWLNLIEGFFSKFARSVLRHIRVTSKHELKERIMAGIDDVNRHPVIHTWSYKLADASDMIRTKETLT